jgi:hypothetical protein
LRIKVRRYRCCESLIVFRILQDIRDRFSRKSMADCIAS